MPIPPGLRQACLDIMDQLMKQPCADPFLDPVNASDAPTYYNIVKKPADLGTIRKKLADDEYQSLAAWSREMSLIWGNTEKFHGRDVPLYLMAMEIKRQFEKEYKKVKPLNMQKWANVVSELKDKMDDLLDNPPDPVTKFATISEKPDPNQLKQFTDDEMDHFIRSTMMLSSEEDAMKMQHIIRLYEPQFKIPGGDVPIDVGSLSVQTLHALREYVNHRMNDLGLTLPSR